MDDGHGGSGGECDTNESGMIVFSAFSAASDTAFALGDTRDEGVPGAAAGRDGAGAQLAPSEVLNYTTTASDW